MLRVAVEVYSLVVVGGDVRKNTIEGADVFMRRLVAVSSGREREQQSTKVQFNRSNSQAKLNPKSAQTSRDITVYMRHSASPKQIPRIQSQ